VDIHNSHTNKPSTDDAPQAVSDLSEAAAPPLRNISPALLDSFRTVEKEGGSVARGSFHRVRRVMGTVKGKVISLVRRELPYAVNAAYRQEKQSALEEEAAMRLYLQRIGVPVIPTLRIDPSTLDTYATDLTQRGKHLVISATNIPIDDERYYQLLQRPAPIISQKQARAALLQVHDIAELCAKNAIEIQSPDALFFIIDPKTCDTRVIAGDYKYFKRSSRPYSDLLLFNQSVCHAAFFTDDNQHFFGLTADDMSEI
jgi:hypothetical protein